MVGMARMFAVAAWCAALGAGAAAAYEARLLKDINRIPRSTSAYGFTPVGPITYFAADSLLYGREIWRTDGTPEGTAIIGEMHPGPGRIGPDSHELTRIGSRIAYRGEDEPHGFELWVSEGTAASTNVLDLCPGQCSSYPERLIAVGNQLYFAAEYIVSEPYTMSFGIELWRSDGTAEGTHMVHDIAPEDGFSYPYPLGALGDRLLFVADDGIHGAEPWVTDGTAAGTELVTDLNPGPTGSDINSWITASTGAVVFFVRDNPTSSLWRSDGTANGTFEVLGEFPDYILKRHGDGVVFTGYDAAHGREPWTSDGTLAGTRLLVDLDPGPSSSDPRSYGSIADDVLILTSYAFDPPSLWRVDASGENLALLRADDRLVEGTDLVSVGSQVYFASPNLLWTTDGTEAGTRIVDGAMQMPDETGFVEIADAGGRAIFTANDEVSVATPWISDGTEDGTFRLADIRMSNYSSEVQGAVQLGDRLLFTASDTVPIIGEPEDAHGQELWATDGSEGGTTLVLDLRPGNRAGASTAPVFFQGMVYFGGENGTQRGLFRSDGTAAGTVPVKTSVSLFARNLTVAGDKLFFVDGLSFMSDELWVSDGTEAGTVLVRDLAPGQAALSARAACDDLLFFVLDENVYGRELWRSDGTDAGTFLVRDVNPGAADSLPSNLRCHQGKLYFNARNGTVGAELWVSDGSAAGTTMVRDIRPGPSSSSPRDLVSYNGVLVFVADDGAHGAELWTSDGTPGGTTLLLDHRPGSSTANPKSLTVVGNRLYFLSNPGNPSRERPFLLDESWSLAEVQAAGLSSFALIGAVGDLLFMGANDGQHGAEPWLVDGTSVAMVADINPSGHSSVRSPIHLGSSLFFLANDGLHGEELWVVAMECGDGAIDPFEQCDDGNAIDGDGCDSNCVPTACGNRVLTAGEECDDGNTADGDCCSAACQLEAAGSPCARDETLACTAEICDGGGACISSTTAATGSVCRATRGACDVAEYCDGTVFHCAADAVADAAATCRAGAGACDVAEHCDGLAPACPGDAMAPAGALCRESAGICDLEETCDGATASCPADSKSTLECRAASDACDLAESCDGLADVCPADVSAPDGTSCADSDFCDGAETCQAGVCSAHSPCLQGCDEATDVCTATCAPLPQDGCRQAASSLFSMSDKDDHARDVMSWRWGKGDATAASEFGDPTRETEQAICIYDAQSGLLAEARIAPGDHWRLLSDRGYKLNDRTAATSPITKALLKAGDSGRAKLTMKGTGASLPDIELPLATQDFPLLVQLVNSETGICWESSFAAEHARTNRAGRLKLKR